LIVSLLICVHDNDGVQFIFDDKQWWTLTIPRS